jgi:hypothetical protein
MCVRILLYYNCIRVYRGNDQRNVIVTGIKYCTTQGREKGTDDHSRARKHPRKYINPIRARIN